MQESFWTRLEALVKASELVIDRPRGSAHPRFPGIIYPLDYGYLKGTSSGDGHEIDVWRGTLPEKRFDAIVCTVDIMKRDAEIKLLIGCSTADKDTVQAFHNGEYMSAILMERGTA